MSGYCPDCGNTICLCDAETKVTYPLRAKIKDLESQLSQQRFNNEHNLSIDQKVSDRIKVLELQLVRSEKFADDNINRLSDACNEKAVKIKELEAQITNLEEFIKEHDMDESLQEWNSCS